MAGRAHIGVPVTDALVQCGAESVLVALVRNATAKISEAAYQTLVDHSRAMPGLQEPLAASRRSARRARQSHVRLGIRSAQGLYPDQLPDSAQTASTSPCRKRPKRSAANPPGPKDPPADSAQKLIEKLGASGQLKAGFLMRVLSQGQIDLFDLAFARLLQKSNSSRFRGLFYEGGVRMVALACRAGGNRQGRVFATVFNLSRQARHEAASLGRSDMDEAEDVFGGFTRPSALAELRSLAANRPLLAA